jgi:hypothetical protein
MFAQGLINRWELHHRLQFGPIKIAQFINQPPLYSMPHPYFPHNDEQLKAYRATVTSSRPGAAGYDAKYRKDTPQTAVAAAASTGAKAAGESKSLRNIPGCLCMVAVSSYGEARVFVELATGPCAVEWSSASTRLSSHELLDTASRSTRASGSRQDASSQHAVVWVEAAALTVRNGQLLLAVAEDSQIIFFTLKTSYWPLKVTAIPHTRFQLKTDIKLHGLLAPAPFPSPSLVRMCFNPTKPEDMIIVYRMGAQGAVGEAGRGWQMKLERLRLKDKPVVANAPAAAASDAESLNWQTEVRHILVDGISDAKFDKFRELTHLSATVDGQFAVLGFSSGVVQLRWLDDLKEAPPTSYPVCLGSGAAEGRSWAALVQSCSSPSGNCMLLLDSVGRAKVVEMPHPWALHAATPVCITNHLVHQLEVSMCKTSELWDVLLPLGGLVRSHPQGMSILEGVLKQVADNLKQVRDDHCKRFWKSMHEMLMLRLLQMSGEEEHVMEAQYCQGRQLLLYLIDAFRFAIPFASLNAPSLTRNSSQGQAAAGGVSGGGVSSSRGPFCSGAMGRLKTQCQETIQALGPTIVALTVWNLHHAIKACELDEANAQRGQAGPELAGPPGLRGGLRYQSVVTDVDALSLTKDLLQQHYKQLQDRNKALNAPTPADHAQGDPSAAPAGAAGNGTMGKAAASGAASAPGMAPVMAPPPLAPEVVDAPLPLDDLDNNAQDSSVTMLETAEDAEGEADGDKVEMLQYDLEDLVHLIKTVNTLLEAHKATTQETATPGAPGGADKTRYTTVLAQKLAQHKVDLQHGLRERLHQRSLARPEFAYAALQSLLALSPYAHGFMARACGYPLSPFVLRQAASCLTFASLPSLLSFILACAAR